MNAFALVYRFRVVIFVALYLLGFLAPWGGTLWLWASTLLARSGWLSLGFATQAITMIALVCLVAGTTLRVWGTAYIGAGIMSGAAMQGARLVVSGPYRYLRNPLYLGAWLLALGTSVLMPVSGAAFFISAFSIFALFLIAAEERFLSARLGDLYQQYRGRVPRLLPRAGSGGGTPGLRPHWLQAVFAETYPVTFTLCFAILAWRYNARILMQCLLICYGASLVVRALLKRSAPPTDSGA